MISAAPASRARAALLSVDVVAITCTPRVASNCVSSSPTPPAAACTSAVSPGRAGYVERVRYWAVSPWRRTAPAVSSSMPAGTGTARAAVSYTHLRAHETRHDLVCRLLLE